MNLSCSEQKKERLVDKETKSLNAI